MNRGYPHKMQRAYQTRGFEIIWTFDIRIPLMVQLSLSGIELCSEFYSYTVDDDLGLNSD